MSRIWDKMTVLKPSAMAAVAQRRFDDAQTLCDTGMNARANGAAYLAGFVVEILLKANLVRLYPWTARSSYHPVTAGERRIWDLVWRQHHLVDMLDQMASVQVSLKQKGQRDRHDYLGDLKKICATWTIHARYSCSNIPMSESRDMVERIRILKELLK